LLYEEVEDYKAFCEAFEIDKHTDGISQVAAHGRLRGRRVNLSVWMAQILEDDDEIRGLHEQMVPVELSYEEFWSRYVPPQRNRIGMVFDRQDLVGIDTFSGASRIGSVSNARPSARRSSASRRRPRPPPGPRWTNFRSTTTMKKSLMRRRLASTRTSEMISRTQEDFEMKPTRKRMR
jgi:hypothetical protein